MPTRTKADAYGIVEGGAGLQGYIAFTRTGPTALKVDLLDTDGVFNSVLHSALTPPSGTWNGGIASFIHPIYDSTVYPPGSCVINTSANEVYVLNILTGSFTLLFNSWPGGFWEVVDFQYYSSVEDVFVFCADPFVFPAANIGKLFRGNTLVKDITLVPDRSFVLGFGPQRSVWFADRLGAYQGDLVIATYFASIVELMFDGSAENDRLSDEIMPHNLQLIIGRGENGHFLHLDEFVDGYIVHRKYPASGSAVNQSWPLSTFWMTNPASYPVMTIQDGTVYVGVVGDADENPSTNVGILKFQEGVPPTLGDLIPIAFTSSPTLQPFKVYPYII